MKNRAALKLTRLLAPGMLPKLKTSFLSFSLTKYHLSQGLNERHLREMTELTVLLHVTEIIAKLFQLNIKTNPKETKQKVEKELQTVKVTICLSQKPDESYINPIFSIR